MEKQKASAINDRDIKPNKIRKIETPILSQIQGPSQIQTNYQSTSENINFTQTIDEPVANNDLVRLIEIWNHGRKDQLISINENQEESKELEERLARAELQVKELESALHKVEEKNVAMTRYLESEVTIQNEIIDKQNFSLYLMSVVEEHTDVITDTLRDCEEDRKNLIELYDRTSFEQEEYMKKLEQSDNRGILRQKELIEQLELKNSELMSAQTRCQQYKTDVAKISQQISELNVAAEEREKMINEKRIKYEEEIGNMSVGVKNAEERFTVQRQENFELAAEGERRSKQLGDLLSQQKALQVTSAQREEQIKYLQFSLGELKEEEINLANKVAELNSEHLVLISNKDLELADYRKQLKDLTLTRMETTNKLSEATSNNRELSQIVAAKMKDIEQLKNCLLNKDDETVELNREATSALEKQEEMYSVIESLKQRLISRENEIEHLEVDSASSNTKNNERAKTMCETRTRLATMQKMLENKFREETELLRKIENDEIAFTKQVKHYKQEILHKDRAVNELTNIKENIQKKTDRRESEHETKMQVIKHSSKQCELAEHEKQIEEQNAKIDSLNREVAAENRKLEEINSQKVERDKQKALAEIELKEKETEFANLKETYALIEQTNKYLNEKWKEVQTLKEAENARKLLSANFSPPLARSYRRNMSISATSTPNPNASRIQGKKFDSGLFPLDLSSINDSTLLEDQACGFDMLVQSDKTDAAKLSEPEARGKLQTPSPSLSVTARAKDNKFVRRSGRKK